LNAGSKLIGTILRHDAKQTSYKIALLRAINDVALSYPDLRFAPHDIAMPLRLIAQFWLAYYWPFMDSFAPVLQGARSVRSGALSNDLSFRDDLTNLKTSWQEQYGLARPADGFVLIHDLKLPRKRASYTEKFLTLYDRTISRIAQAIRQPIKYAGQGAWSVFTPPKKLIDLSQVTSVPGALPSDMCLVVSRELWQSFQDLSHWIEALCIHEWSLFTERIEQSRPITRGEIYTLLTERPDNRRPLTWERNQVELLMLEGHIFTCPWSFKTLRPENYALDHLIPISVFPINELWNLVPSDPRANSHLKRARLPSEARWEEAIPYIQRTYQAYKTSSALGPYLAHDAKQRFSTQHQDTPEELTKIVGDFMRILTEGRNLAVF
jgi:hypothetical protein